MDTADDLISRFERLNDIGTSLSAEHDLPVLFEKIVVAAMQLANADAGTLYRISDDRRRLQFEIIRTDSLAVALGG